MQQVQSERSSQIDNSAYPGACFLVLYYLNHMRAKLDGILIYGVDCKLRIKGQWMGLIRYQKLKRGRFFSRSQLDGILSQEVFFTSSC